MYSDNSSPTLTEVEFVDNQTNSETGGEGGGLNLYQSMATLTHVAFTGTVPSTMAAACSARKARQHSTDVTFSENHARLGGGMKNVGGNATLTDVTFSRNTALEILVSCGGGMENVDSSPTLTHVTFDANVSLLGGGLCNQASSPSLSDVEFIGNFAKPRAGGCSIK